MKVEYEKQKRMVQQEVDVPVYISEDGSKWTSESQAVKRDKILKLNQIHKIKEFQDSEDDTVLIGYFEDKSHVLNYKKEIQNYAQISYDHGMNFPCWVSINIDESGDYTYWCVQDAKQQIKELEEEIKFVNEFINNIRIIIE